MRDMLFSRRSFLIAGTAAASLLGTRVGFAAAPGENRLVVIVLRGAMDGLDVVRPLGDRDLRGLRPKLTAGAYDAPLDLDGFFALNPGAGALMPLWQAGELGFAHAVATPYRAQRSHFVGQDLLETGGPAGAAPGTSGWLNRALGRIPGASPELAVTIGREPMLILEGDAPARQWLPAADSTLSGQGEALLTRLHAADPAFAESFRQALMLRAETDAERIVGKDDKRDQLGAYVAARLNAEARIAAFSLGGWDTHHNQAPALERRLGVLSDTILALKTGLAGNWGSTLVLAMTEFGRTARENGSGGTDHGTGGAVLLAGGALRGRRVMGRWPGLSETALYGKRDLMPTGDLRAYAGWALHDLFGVATAEIEGAVFPALDLGPSPRLIR